MHDKSENVVIVPSNNLHVDVGDREIVKNLLSV
jgi:hypothetical protein